MWTHLPCHCYEESNASKEKVMSTISAVFLQVTTHVTLYFSLLIIGAMFTAAVGVSIFSFYLDEYWEDEDYRNELRYGRRKKRNNKQQKV